MIKTNLFNFGINKILHDGGEVLLMRLNGDVIFHKEKFCIKYTVSSWSSWYLDDYDSDPGYFSCFPRIYTSETEYSYTYSDIIVTKKDGTIMSKKIIDSDFHIPCSEVKEIEIFFPVDTYGIKFYAPPNNDDITIKIEDIKYCNTSNFVSMKEMFFGCGDLKEVKSGNWDTSNVIDMSFMFADDASMWVKSIDVSNFNTSNVTNMQSMFASCSFLTTLDVSNWDTSKVTDMNYMFYDCDNLTTLDVSNWDTSNVTNMSYMFELCRSLTTLDVSNWDTSNVTNMSCMFFSCDNLTTLDLSNWDTSNVTDMNGMFYHCKSLTTLNLSSFDINHIQLFNKLVSMFTECTNLVNLQAPKNIRTHISFVSCEKLSHDSLMSIINNLATVTSTRTLTLGATNLAKLTTEEIAIATNKGWTVS